MAEKSEGKKKKKGGIVGGDKGSVIAILAPILIVVIIAVIFFAIIEGIAQLILEELGAILEADLLTSPLKTLSAWGGSITNWFDRELGWGEGFDENAYENKRKDFNATVEISQETFEQMRDKLENAVDREAEGVGLDDVMLKKMLLAYNRGIYFHDTNIIIELTEEELDFISENGEQTIKPFSVVEGDEDSALGEDGKKYLKAKGMIQVQLNGTDTDLIFYPLETLKEIYQKEYVGALEKEREEYAESVLKYLGKCYTYCDSGIQMYATTTDSKDVTWNYKNIGVEYKLNDSYKDTRVNLITIEYSEKVLQYATPVEFMVNLMELTGSKEFINTFIEAVGTKNYIKMDLCDLTYTETTTETYERDTETNIIGELDEGSTGEKVKSDSSKVIYTEEVKHKEVKYDLLLTGVETWYAKITQDNEEKITTTYTTINEEESEVEIRSPDLAIKIPQDDQETTYTSDTNPGIFSYELMDVEGFDSFHHSIRGYTKEECLNMQFAYVTTLPEEGYDFREYLFETMNCKDTNKTKSTLKTIAEKRYIEGTPTIIDNTDIFLALLSGSDSRYEVGDSFISKADGGKVVMYLDLYKAAVEETRKLEDGTEITSEYGIVGVGELLENGAEMLFDLLERSPNTQGLADIMKYIMYRYSGKDYGVTEFSFEIYDPNLFTSQGKSGTALLMEYLHAVEGTEDTPVSDDGTKYIIYDDGSGNHMVGHGIDIIGGGYQTLFEEAGYSVQIGAEVDKEFVDELEEQEISDIVNEVREKTKNLDLKEYQIHALVARVRDCGMTEALGIKNGKTFEQAYNEYWDQERDDLFEVKDSSPNLTHDLYIQYLNKPNDTEGSLKQRKSEWTLFQTGYYKEIDSWYPDTGEILNQCVEVMNDLIKHNVRYNRYNLAYSNVEKSNDFSRYASVCSTYVTVVLYRAGIFPAEFINRYAYNCPEGLNDMLSEAGWILVTPEEAQPGDICNFTVGKGGDTSFRHSFIYAGGNEVWDQASGCIGTDGTPPLRGTKSAWSYYVNNAADLKVWRMP